MASPGAVVIQFLVDAKKAAKDAADLAKNFGKVDDEADRLDATLSGLESELDSIGRSTADLKSDMQKAGVGFDDVGDEAEQAADRVRRAAQDMARGVHAGGQDIDTETGHIRRNMADTGREAGGEFIENIAEGIGSGTSTIADTIQGTLGGITNLAASLGGPIGLAAGAAAAGVGVVFAKVKAESEKAAAEVQEMIDLLWEVGDTTSAIAKQKIWEDWQADLKEDIPLMNDLADATLLAGITAEEMQGAITGDPAAQQAVVDKLTKVGATIADNVKKGKPLTEAQREYLGNQGKIHEQLKKAGIELDKTKETQRALEILTGNTEEAAKKWADEIRAAEKDARSLKEQMEAAAQDRNATINVAIKYTDPSGKPTNARPAGLAAGPTTMAMTAQQAPPVVLPPINVSVNLDQWGQARVTKRALEANDRRQGRPVGAPLRVAW